MSRLDTFDPNARTKPKYEWATFCPSRHPEFKVHSKRGHAISALRPSGSILYQWEDGLWVERYRFEEGRYQYRNASCEWCHRVAPYGLYVAWEKSDGKIKDTLKAWLICSDCQYARVVG